MSEASTRERVLVANPSDGGLLYWLVRLYLFAALGVVMAAGLALVAVYAHFARQLPPLPDISRYALEAPSVTRLEAIDGSLIGELASERREVVPLSRIPRPLIDAFLATEDRRFFSHAGLDVRGMARALWANVRAGQVLQGGSTITQQIAKAFLSAERSFSRKLKEAIFARRLEARYTKREILALYLNHIFLGNGAYGVGAAARRYFDRDVEELDVGQQAMLAGLARAPSRYSPLGDLKMALERRATVLANMAEVGALSAEEADRWRAAPLGLRSPRDPLREVAPYFAEHVRRTLVRQLGQRTVYEGGLRVETTVDPWVDLLAQENVDAASRRLDKRQGWRGPEARLTAPERERFRARAAELYGDGPPEEQRLYLGLVEKVSSARAEVRIGTRTYGLPIENMVWAAPYQARDATNDRTISSVGQALRVGDVVWVRWNHRSRVARFSEFTYDELGEPVWAAPQDAVPRPREVLLSLEQTPRVQSAVFAFDHRNGYVVSLVGGNDFDRSEFNRVTQSCRQPGSAYKPVYYSLALDRGYSYDTLWNDRPKPEIDPVTGEMWIPQNIDGSYNVQTSLERALVWSKNPPSVEIFHILGSRDVEAWAHRLGLSTPLVTSPKCDKEFCSSLALGASCVHMDELTKAFAVFARGGTAVEPVFIRRVTDREGRILADHTTWDDPWLLPEDRLDRMAVGAGLPKEPVIEPRTAWLTSRLLREIVTMGHSGPIRATRVPTAGKTGTSSHTSDVWFSGYTSRWMVSTWMGDDTYERQLGYKDASFMLTVPLFARFVAAATQGQPLEEIADAPPPGVKPGDRGGPLKKGFAPPPDIGFGVDGLPVVLPDRLKEMMRPGAPMRGTGLPVKVIRVPTASPGPGLPPVSPGPGAPSVSPSPGVP